MTRRSTGPADHRLTAPIDQRPGAFVDLFEYQGKQFFATFGIPVSPGDVATTVDEAVAGGRAHRLPGRGQGPGAGGRAGQGRRHQARQRRRRGAHARRRTSSAWTSRATPSSASGSSRPPTSPRSTTPASPSTARPRSTSACSRPRAASRSRRCAETDPDAIAKIWIDPVDGLTEDAARAWVAEAEARTRRPPTAPSTSCSSSTTAYIEGDADLVEINPLILTPDGQVHALDAKVTLDGNVGVPPPRLRASTRPPRSATSARRRPTTRACSTSASTAPSASSPTAPAWP